MKKKSWIFFLCDSEWWEGENCKIINSNEFEICEIKFSSSIIPIRTKLIEPKTRLNSDEYFST